MISSSDHERRHHNKYLLPEFLIPPFHRVFKNVRAGADDGSFGGDVDSGSACDFSGGDSGEESKVLLSLPEDTFSSRAGAGAAASLDLPVSVVEIFSHITRPFHMRCGKTSENRYEFPLPTNICS